MAIDALPSGPVKLPPSVNFHLWEPCNMRCRFCFATFQDVKRAILPRGHLPREQALAVVAQLAEAGLNKITFAGGEPTLCPWLGDLITLAKQRHMTTMLVTNGSRLLQPGWLDEHGANLDRVVLSIDSADPLTHERLGRSIAGQAGRAVRLKVNTVVTAENANEDMAELLLALRPERWKVLQCLPVGGQNDGKVAPLLIDEVTFQRYCARHRRVAKAGISLVPKDNEDMTGSYAMVDPAERFFDNTSGSHRYSGAILEHGVTACWQQVSFDARRFERRGGIYDWAATADPTLVQVRRAR